MPACTRVYSTWQPRKEQRPTDITSRLRFSWRSAPSPVGLFLLHEHSIRNSKTSRRFTDNHDHTDGYNSAIIGSVIGQPSFYTYFDFEATSSYGASIIGALNGLYAGAGVIGSLSVFNLLDILGRRLAIQVAAAVCVVTAALQAGSVHIAMFLVARFFNGLGVAWLNCSVPTYLSEISPAVQRGRVVGAHGFIICCGYVNPPGCHAILLCD